MWESNPSRLFKTLMLLILRTYERDRIAEINTLGTILVQFAVRWRVATDGYLPGTPTGRVPVR